MQTTGRIEEKLLEFLKHEVFDLSITLDNETNLLDAGLDSLTLIKLLLFIEETYKIWLPESEITETNLKNVRNLANVIRKIINDA